MNKPYVTFRWLPMIFFIFGIAMNLSAQAVTILYPTEGYSVSGTATFTEVKGGVRVVANITGLTPGEHGFHIHTYGDCTDPKGKSAGGHFNPEVTPHGAPQNPADKRHIGDLGNIIADANGHAQMDVVDPLLTLKGPQSIIGRAVVVHGGRDDLTSQPSGAAGPRVACGVIGISK